jgi:hypothetical protein
MKNCDFSIWKIEIRAMVTPPVALLSSEPSRVMKIFQGH